MVPAPRGFTPLILLLDKDFPSVVHIDAASGGLAVETATVHQVPRAGLIGHCPLSFVHCDDACCGVIAKVQTEGADLACVVVRREALQLEVGAAGAYLHGGVGIVEGVSGAEVDDATVYAGDVNRAAVAHEIDILGLDVGGGVADKDVGEHGVMNIYAHFRLRDDLAAAYLPAAAEGCEEVVARHAAGAGALRVAEGLGVVAVAERAAALAECVVSIVAQSYGGGCKETVGDADGAASDKAAVIIAGAKGGRLEHLAVEQAVRDGKRAGS